ncbi:MAG TPA: sugar phosphate isomerase/epimerase family protein [Trueperaceae bacterium]
MNGRSDAGAWVKSPLERLSLNQATVQSWGVRETIEGCARHGIPYVGLWRDKLAQEGVESARRLLEETGVKVSSLCRGGFFPAPTESERRERIDDNRRAIDEAAAVGTDVLVLVCGGIAGRDLEGSRRMVEEGIAEVLPYASERGVKLGIEPLHPMFAADRSVICTLGQAVAMAQRLDSAAVGVVVDVYHVWWDDQVYELIERATGRIIGFHVDDWLAPPPDVLMGRGMMGDGAIDLSGLFEAVARAGYDGPVEVEIFNRDIWETPADEVVALMKERYRRHVLGDG